MANSNFIQEAIFKAVDVILEKRLKSLQVNYCITGIIEEGPMRDDKNELYYLVNYQDMLIKAYPITTGAEFKINKIIVSENEVITKTPMYNKGDLVYTLVVNGDLSKKRIILCKA